MGENEIGRAGGKWNLLLHPDNGRFFRHTADGYPKVMDKIILKGIRFHGYHGVAEAERQLGQKYEIDLELTTNLSTAGKTDDLAHTIDYAQVIQLVIEIGTQGSFQLFEALAETIAEAILVQFQIEEIRITVKKLSPPIEPRLTYAGVEIHRKRKSDG